jgi:hypothetical protein
MDDLKLGKGVVGIAYPQTFETIPFAGENFFQSVQKQSFAEAAGPGKKVMPHRASQKIVNISGFVGIQKYLVDYFRERLIFDRQVFKGHDCDLSAKSSSGQF